MSYINYPPWLTPPPDEGTMEGTEVEYEQKEVVQFFEGQMDDLGEISYRDSMTHDIAKTLKDRLIASSNHESEWRDLASDLGFTDCAILNEIDFVATKTRGIHPFYYFLTKTLRNSDGHWDQFIRVLMKNERLDLMDALRPLVQDIKAASTKKDHHNRTDSESSTELSQNDNLADMFSSIHLSSESTFDSQASSIIDNTQMLSEDIAFVNLDSGIRDNVTRANLMESHCVNEQYQQARPLTNINISANADNDSRNEVEKLEDFFLRRKIVDQITVFLSHAEDGRNVAAQVATELRNAGFAVFVQGEEDCVFSMEPHMTIKKLARLVDFFVPIVTPGYLREIDILPCSEERSNDSFLVRELFYNFQDTKFVKQQCINYTIKPLLAEGVSVRKVREYVELSCYMKLWEELPRFCKLLIDTIKHKKSVQRA